MISFSHAGKATHNSNDSSLWPLMTLLFLMLIGEVYTSSNPVHLVKTSGGSVENISLPDEQVVYLLFWMEGPVKEEPEGVGQTTGDIYFPLEREEEKEGSTEISGKEGEDEGPLVQFKEDDEGEARLSPDEEEEDNEVVLLDIRQEEKIMTEDEGLETGNRPAHDAMVKEGGTRKRKDRGREEANTVILSYFVSSFQYPTLTFALPQHNVWYTATFDYHSVSIPVADVYKFPIPSSWWERRVTVSSGSTVYWQLCTSQPCAQGRPESLLQDAKTKHTASTDLDGTRGVERVLVVVLGTFSGVLLPVCLGLLAIVITLRRRSVSRATPRHPQQSCSCRTSQQRGSSVGL